MQKTYKLIFIALVLIGLCVSGVQASYTGVYPPAYNTTYVKATSTFSASFQPWFTVNPSLSLTGDYVNNQWISGSGFNTSQRFHIDLGTARPISQIYYENSHASGTYTDVGVRNYTLWGTNSSASFQNLTYTNDTGWYAISTNTTSFDQHVSTDTADPKYIQLSNVATYRYFAFKFENTYGSSVVHSMGVRRIELQEWENTYYGFGDSISAYDNMYVMQMVSKYDPVNGTASHNYDGSSMASWWGAGAFNTHPPSSHPDKYFTLIGVNDRVIDPTYGANQTADNLYAIYSGVASNGSTPYIVLYPARESAGTYSDQLDNMTKIKQRLDYHRVSYIMGYDAYDLLPGNNVFDDINYTSQPDGVHPSSAAHLLLADYVWDHLTPGSATFNQNQSSGALSISVLFTDTTDKNPTMWNWSFGDGTHSTEQNPIHTYDAGNYSVTLIATNAGGSSTSTQNSWVNVSGPPTYLSEYDASRVLTLHMNQSPIHPTWFNDSSKNNLIFDTFGQATTTTSYKPFGNASGLFDGDGDYISTPKTSNLDLDVGERNYTILYWSKPTSGVGDKYYFELVNNSGYQSVLLESYSDTLFVLDRINATNTWYIFGTVDNSAGHQYVIQRISNKLYVYKDGVVQTLTPSAAGGDVGGLTKSIIGGANGILTSRYYNGSLDEYNVWKTDIPISKLYPQLYEVGQTPLIANFAYVPSGGSVPFLVTFTDTSTNATALIDSWYWVFGDQGAGNTSSLQNPTHTYTVAGTYITNLTIRNTTYDLTSTKLQTIIANATLSADFTGAPTTGGVPLGVSFTDDSTGVRTGWLWTFGDGNISTLQNPSHTYVNPGSYNVDLNITGPDGTTNLTKNAYITATDAPTANWTANKYYGIAPLPITFTDASTGAGITWGWDFGDGNFSVLQNPTHTFVSNGEYQVNLTVTNVFGSSSKLRNITVSDFSSSFSGSPVVGPFPLTVAFTETTTGLKPDSFYYEFGDGNTSTSQNPTHTYVNHGYYTVNNRITNGSTVYWNNKTNYIEAWGETASFTVSNTTAIDAPLVVLFTSTTTNTNATPSSYLWVFGDGTQSTSGSSVTHTYDTTFGTFNANLTTSNVTQGVSSTSASATLSRIPSNTVSNISYNWVMNQIFPTTIMVKDSETLALIAGVVVTTEDNVEYTLTNGILAQSFEYGSHTFAFEADGYYSKTTSLFIVGNSTFTVLLTPSVVAEQQKLNLLYPHEVRIITVDAHGNRLANVNVTSTMLTTTVEGTNWFETLFGISSSATPVKNTTVMGYTDSYGSIIFPMISSGRYRLTFSEPSIGVNQQMDLYPDQAAYSIVLLTTATVPIPFSGDYINSTLTASDLGDTVSLNMTYRDNSSTTNDLTFYVRFANQSLLHSEVFTSPTNLNSAYAVANVADSAYVWGFAANNSRFGWQNQSNGITLKGAAGVLYDPFSYKGRW